MIQVSFAYHVKQKSCSSFLISSQHEETIGEVDNKVQLYLEKLREKGGGVSSRIAIVAGHALLLKYNRSLLHEYRIAGNIGECFNLRF